MFRSSCLLATLASILAASPQVASAQSRVAVGVLECRAGPATTFVVGSVRDFDCLFRPANAPPQRYGATIQRLGVDLGWSSDAALVWQVFAPTNVIGPGALAGGYGGVSAGAAVGFGLAANAMAGGTEQLVRASAAQRRRADGPQCFCRDFKSGVETAAI